MIQGDGLVQSGHRRFPRRAQSAATIQAKLEEVKKYKAMYDNPLINAAMTFLEPFPIGLVITLLSAAFLRKKPQAQLAQSPLPAR